MILVLLSHSACQTELNLAEGRLSNNQMGLFPEPASFLLTLVLEVIAAAASKLLQLCPTLCNPTDGSPPGSPVPGILQARTLEWVATAFSDAWKGKGKGKSLGRVRLFPTPWTAAYRAPSPLAWRPDFPGAPREAH